MGTFFYSMGVVASYKPLEVRVDGGQLSRRQTRGTEEESASPAQRHKEVVVQVRNLTDMEDFGAGEQQVHPVYRFVRARVKIDVPKRTGLRVRHCAPRACNLTADEGNARLGHHVILVCFPFNRNQPIEEPPQVRGDVLQKRCITSYGAAAGPILHR